MGRLALRGCAGVAVAVAAALLNAAHAEPAPPFAALLAQARANAPRFAEAEAEVAQAQGLARQAATRPNPVLSVDVENLNNVGAPEGLDPRQTTVAVEQTLELGGKRSARAAAGRAGVTAAQARSEMARAEFAAQLAVAYAEAEAASARFTQA